MYFALVICLLCTVPHMAPVATSNGSSAKESYIIDTPTGCHISSPSRRIGKMEVNLQTIANIPNGPGMSCIYMAMCVCTYEGMHGVNVWVCVYVCINIYI